MPQQTFGVGTVPLVLKVGERLHLADWFGRR